MSLFVRVEIGFWTHRKTIRLRSMLGDSALWLPPRLWSYAAQNQPDGDFSNYTAEELALLLGYSSNASSMLQALQAAGFMDGMKIHDWEIHNSYHEKFSERARAAAKARWGKDKKRKEKRGEEQALLKHALSNASSITPSMGEFVTYMVANAGISEEYAKARWGRYDSAGWVNGSNIPIKKWQSLASTLQADYRSDLAKPGRKGPNAQPGAAPVKYDTRTQAERDAEFYAKREGGQ